MVPRKEGFFSSQLKSIPASVWCLGFVTLLKNMSSVVLTTFSPLFLREVLGVSVLTLAVLEGGVEAISFFARIFAGVVSDSLRKRKVLILIGYVLSLVSRLFLALSTSILEVFFSRSCERIGNGIQASPRDALVADLSTPENRGACYGLRQSLTIAGSLVGAILGMILMWWTARNYRLIFFLTLIPSSLAILLLIVGVKEPTSLTRSSGKRRFHWSDIQEDLAMLTTPYWKLVTLSSLFMVANFSISFLILRAEACGLGLAWLPLIMIIQSLATVFSAFPFGRLADVINRRWVLGLGFCFLALGNGVLALSDSITGVLIAAALWGLQMGVTQSNFMAYIAQVSPQEVRGTGFGVFHFLNGLAVFLGNGMMGFFWEKVSPSWAFGSSALVVVLSIVFLNPLTPSKSTA